MKDFCGMRGVGFGMLGNVKIDALKMALKAGCSFLFRIIKSMLMVIMNLLKVIMMSLTVVMNLLKAVMNLTMIILILFYTIRWIYS